MLHCHDCFHNCVCGNSSPYNDVTMCKQFLNHLDVAHGKELNELYHKLETSEGEISKLEIKLRDSALRSLGLEREVELLRIIKQTLEMQSGMKFDI